jgi:glucuronokinase
MRGSTRAAGAAEGHAPARAALAGNPSDGYGGAVLALALPGFGATARATRAAETTITPPSELVAATVRRYARLHPQAPAAAVTWETSIPRGVGLGGSSAIVIATLRALGGLHAAVAPEAELAEVALAVETEELGIAAGLQDRVAQAYGGLTFMDFAGGGRRYERLDPALLPPLLVAWRSTAAEDSGVVHGDLRARFRRGEPSVRRAVTWLARCAREARAALRARDLDGFARCVDATFEARRQLLALASSHVEMIEVARGCGASANYTGSGGAIVAVCNDERHRETVALALEQVGCGTERVDPSRQMS